MTLSHQTSIPVENRLTNHTLVILAAIIGLACFLRVYFVLAVPQPPVIWDASGYDSLARGIADMKKHAFGVVLKGPVYPAYLALIYIIFGKSYTAVGVIQALTDTLTCLMIFFLAKRLFSVRAGIAAVAAACLYMPFIYYTGVLLQETLTAFLSTLLVLSLYKAMDQCSGKMLFLSGILAGVMALTKAAMSYLWIPVLIYLFWALKKKHVEGASRLALSYGAGAIVVLFSWMTLTSVLGAMMPSFPKKQGFFQLHTKNDHYAELLASNYSLNDGWSADITGEIDHIMSTSPIKAFRDHQGNPDYLKLAVDQFLQRPFSVILLNIKKFYRLWKQPANNYNLRFFLPNNVVVLLHHIILALALLAIPLCMAQGKPISLLVIIAAFMSLIYTAHHVESRYNLAAMPMVIVLASGAFDYVAGLFKNLRTPQSCAHSISA